MTNSPNIISAVSIGASVVTTVAATVLSTDAALGLAVLQTSAAFMGAVVGCVGIQKLPNIARWGYNTASNAKNYVSSKIGFWSSNPVDLIEKAKNSESISSKNFNFQ